jgi:alanyl-tRNA synthetase
MLSSNEIRQQFIDFFVNKHGHTAVPSSPVVPTDDPTLLFTNAGMNQFKDVFLGTGSRPYRRAVDTQKCIRAGGKHNDLDDVGKDTYHHTFFEMLGNWSFGDYFKKEAIRWAWQLLTEVWKLDKSRLHATVFEGSAEEGVPRDDEAFELWKSETDIDPKNIHWGNKKDNFWEMGETGPCGPCTEIHIDRTPDKSGGKLVNAGTPNVIEIWNLVFIQYNRNPDRSLVCLPARHVDTGMGFERVTAVIQRKASNYDTDVFTPLFDAIQKVTGAPGYTGNLDDLKDTAYRVIADHIRALTFSLTDGARPSNEKRGYVVRSILRRAERYGRQVLGTTRPFLHELVPTVVELMSGPFPELRKAPGKVAEVILKEEEAFIRTLDRGLKLFQEVVQRTRGRGEKVISGKDAFDLHTTYGFFIDITEQMAAEVGLRVDRQEYERLFQIFKEESSKGRKQFVITAIQGELPQTDDSPKYGKLTAEGNIVGWVRDSTVETTGQLEADEEAALLLDRTNFYAEQGGQVGDSGTISTPSGRFEVETTQRLGDGILHIGRVTEGHIEPGQHANLEVSGIRADTMRNHTATHLLNWALREVLGEHVEQKGSLVDAEKTRFDFSHEKPITKEEIAEIERLVNEKIYADLTVTPVTMSLVEAKKLPGVRAVFGEKYPDPVRVLMIGPEKPTEATPEHSIEFCGGTHLCHTGQAGFFKIVSQELVAKGVRRLTAVTGKGAVEAVQRMASVLDDLSGRFNCKPEEVFSRIESLQEEVKKLQQQIKKGTAGDLQAAADKLFSSSVEVNGARIIAGEMPPGPIEQMQQQADRLRQKAGSAVVVLGWAEEGKVQLMAAATDDLVKKGVHAGNLIKAIAPVVGGKGGGRPNMAQAGGKDVDKLAEAMEQAKELARKQIRG